MGDFPTHLTGWCSTYGYGLVGIARYPCNTVQYHLTHTIIPRAFDDSTRYPTFTGIRRVNDSTRCTTSTGIQRFDKVFDGHSTIRRFDKVLDIDGHSTMQLFDKIFDIDAGIRQFGDSRGIRHRRAFDVRYLTSTSIRQFDDSARYSTPTGIRRFGKVFNELSTIRRLDKTFNIDGRATIFQGIRHQRIFDDSTNYSTSMGIPQFDDSTRHSTFTGIRRFNDSTRYTTSRAFNDSTRYSTGIRRFDKEFNIHGHSTFQ